MIAQNDNQTAAEFNAGLPPNPCASVSTYAGPSPAGGVEYHLHRDGAEWMLARLGMTLVMPEMRRAPTPAFGLAPTAGAPHPCCPEHTYAPPTSAPRGQNKKVGRPGFIRGVAIGDGRSTEKRAHLRAI